MVKTTTFKEQNIYWLYQRIEDFIKLNQCEVVSLNITVDHESTGSPDHYRYYAFLIYKKEVEVNE